MVKIGSPTSSISFSSSSLMASNIVDHPSLQVTHQKLNGGKNFRECYRSVLLFIRGKGKMEYLTSTTPPTDESAFAKWESENSIVMAWLINSMEPSISRVCLFCTTAKEVWELVQKLYSDLDNAAQCFEIRNTLKNTRQGSSTVTEYFNKVTSLWKELDLFYDQDWKHPEDALKFKILLEKDRVFDFLCGLNKDLDEVRGRLIGIKPLPSLLDVFAEVRREESRKRVMLNIDDVMELSPPPSALVSKKFNGDQRLTKKNDKPWCDHCQKFYHTRDTCWKLHGKPADWKPKSKIDPTRAYQATTLEEKSIPALLSPEQLNQIQVFLSQNTGYNPISSSATPA